MMTIPLSCRGFDAKNLVERRQVAKDLVETFVSDVAPHKRWKDATPIWTERVGNQFIKLCPEDCDAVPNKEEGEYLVDFVWMEKRGLGGRVVLACESEWALDRFGTQTSWHLVEDDFEKLLAVKAPYKLLIFSSVPEHRRNNSDPAVNFSIQTAKDHITKSLQNYWHQLSGESYILLDFPETGDKDGDGVYDAYIWIAEKDGESEVKFDHLAEGKLNRPLND